MNITHTFELGLVVAFDILATMGLVFTIGCLIFNIVFRKRKYVEIDLNLQADSKSVFLQQNSEDLQSKPQLFHHTRSFPHVYLYIFCCIAQSEPHHCLNRMPRKYNVRVLSRI